jgi:hypothetical protein
MFFFLVGKAQVDLFQTEVFSWYVERMAGKPKVRNREIMNHQ